jgi:pyruvate dehydrogenase E2 component (dihydrolipoamide acetyltransferase)
MQRAVARRMAESKATVPHFYLEVEVDMGRATSFRAELNAALSDVGEKVSVNDFIIRACALALVDNRQFHRSFAGDRMVYHPHADIGVAVALDDGLVVPVVRAAETKSLREIAREARDLASRARSGQIKQPEIENATFTISNLGMLDVEEFSAIINPPEGAILAVGSMLEKAVVVDGALAVGRRMKMTISCDHRVMDGAMGARFLQDVKRLLEEPLRLLV